MRIILSMLVLFLRHSRLSISLRIIWEKIRMPLLVAAARFEERSAVLRVCS